MVKYVVGIAIILGAALMPAQAQTETKVPVSSPLYKPQLPIVIKNGIFYRGGKPFFISGFTIDLVRDLNVQGGEWKDSNHRMYSGKVDCELMDEFGLNAYHFWGAWGWFFFNKYFPGALDDETKKFYKEQLELQKEFTDGIGPCASIQDFMLNAWIFDKGYSKVRQLIPAEAFQVNSEWHDFFRFDPANPIGREYYRTDYQEYTSFILKLGSNPFIYELLNEPHYNSFSKENLSLFEQWVKDHYKTIENANLQWGSSFKSMEETISFLKKEQIAVSKREPGLWIEWMKFLSNALSGYLKGFKEDILSVDKRPVPKYFTVQPSGIPNISRTSAFDYALLMEWFDVMVIEYGGVVYGEQLAEENNPYAKGANMKRIEQMVNMDLARGLAHGKPLCDNEMACRRSEGLRVPAHDYDLGTSLWEEVMHGISSTMVYTWGSRSFEWKTFEEAKANGRATGYGASALQNPYNYPFSSLQDLKRFRTEIDRMTDIVLPTPRTKGKVAIIFAHKHSWLNEVADMKNFCYVQEALLNLHMPCDYLIDLYLEKDKNLNQYPMVLAPSLKYCPPSLKAQLEEYVKAGGILLSFPLAFTADDYAKPVNPEPLLGVSSRKTDRKAKKLDFSVPVENPRNLDLISNELILEPSAGTEVFAKSHEEGAPLIVRRNLGKGKIYTLGFIKTRGKCLSSVLGTIFREEKIMKDADVLRIPEGDIENSVELNLINRGDKRFVYLVNWDTKPKLSKLVFPSPAGEWRLVDVMRWKEILSPKGKPVWTESDIKGGIELFLPTEQRVLVLLSRAPVEGLDGSFSVKEFQKEYESAKKR